MRALLLALLSLVAPNAVAQDDVGEEAAPAGDDTTTLDAILVTAPPPEIIDLYKFRNPVDAPPTAFAGWREKPSLKEIGTNGGVVPIIAGYAALKVRDGARKIPGWKTPEQPAFARPPPLTEAQLKRASRLHEDSQ
jgi:hypothetical protein